MSDLTNLGTPTANLTRAEVLSKRFNYQYRSYIPHSVEKLCCLIKVANHLNQKGKENIYISKLCVVNCVSSQAKKRQRNEDYLNTPSVSRPQQLYTP